MSRDGNGVYSLPVNSWNPAIDGNAATTVDWQSLINDVATALTQSVSSDGQTPMTGDLNMNGNRIENLAAGVSTTDAANVGQIYNQGIEQPVASAATTDIGIINSNFIQITGTTTITSLGTTYRGPRFVRFSDALTLTHNAATLILPGGGNITTAAGDKAIFVPKGAPSDGWNCVVYQFASGVMATAPALATDIQRTQNGTYVFLTGVAGTNTITATAPSPFTAYVEGQVFRFKAANAPTGAVTLNINAVGAKAVQLGGSALVGQEYAANAYVEVIYDGTQFQLLSATSNKTIYYTPTLTNTLNIAASTENEVWATRNWNVVSMGGTFIADPTSANTQTELGMSLAPGLTSNFTSSTEAAGTFNTSIVALSIQTDNGPVLSDSVNDRLNFRWYPASTANNTYFFNASYKILG